VTAHVEPAMTGCECRDDEVLICRCQEVSRADVREAIRGGACTLRDVKLRTEAMMGLCQGRTCSREIARELAAAGNAPGEILSRRVRPPVRPVPLEALAAGEGQ
jgi:NAD(P)H-nitrite reductase large subunit